jgi:hypothetical protein
LILAIIPGTWLDRSLWGVLFAAFGILEYLGVRKKWGFTSLTDLTLDIVPRWILAAALGLLCWHFLIQHP